MKCIVFCLLLVGLMVATPTKGAGTCPAGTHTYTTACGYLTPEATCANPNPVPDTRGALCDYSACYCDAPTVRDEKTGLCVDKDKCT